MHRADNSHVFKGVVARKDTMSHILESMIGFNFSEDLLIVFPEI